MNEVCVIIDYSKREDGGKSRESCQQFIYKTPTFNLTVFNEEDSKFKNDNVFYQDDEYLVVINGIILNKMEIWGRSQKDTWSETVIELFKVHRDKLFKILSGSYSGVIYDKLDNKLYAFSDNINSKQIFYYQTDDLILIGSEISWFIRFLKNRRMSLDETAAYMLLSHGYLLSDYTLFSEIRKLRAGSYISVQGRYIVVSRYHKFGIFSSSIIKKEEFVDGIDALFRKAVTLQFEKDREYGFKHLVGLSGGLDSRMVTWVASTLGYKDILNYTFSESGYLDQVIAEEITKNLKNNWHFEPLDGGDFLHDYLEKTVMLNYGSSIFSLIATGMSLFDNLDLSEYGINHTGHLGDRVLGSYYFNLTDYNNHYPGPLYIKSNKLAGKIEYVTKRIEKEYPNTELYRLYNHGFNGTNQGLLAGKQITTSSSPFLNKEFLEFCLSIPVSERIYHKIYREWIIKKYPKAARFEWEATAAKLSAPSILIKGKRRYIPEIQSYLFNKVYKLLKLNSSDRMSKDRMVPMEYWYYTNKKLKRGLDDYYKLNIERLESYPELKKDCEILYGKGDLIEKSQVLTLLASMKLFFE